VYETEQSEAAVVYILAMQKKMIMIWSFSSARLHHCLQMHNDIRKTLLG
jgi:hypothetical protein